MFFNERPTKIRSVKNIIMDSEINGKEKIFSHSSRQITRILIRIFTRCVAMINVRLTCLHFGKSRQISVSLTGGLLQCTFRPKIQEVCFARQRKKENKDLRPSQYFYLKNIRLHYQYMALFQRKKINFYFTTTAERGSLWSFCRMCLVFYVKQQRIVYCLASRRRYRVKDNFLTLIKSHFWSKYFLVASSAIKIINCEKIGG